MQEPYKIKRLVKTETRKFWKGDSSISYVTSLPKDWVEEHIPGYSQKEKRVINLSQIGETLLITPIENEREEKPKSLKLTINRDNTNQIYYSVISAYLQNYDDVRFKEEVSNPGLVGKLHSIDEKLPGAEFKSNDDGYQVTFERKIENIPRKVDEIYDHYVELYSQNQKMFSGKIKDPDVEVGYNIVTKKENLVDNQVFALKRLFTHVFETLWNDPRILIETGLIRDKEDIDYTAAYKIVGYRSVANYLERGTDIQKGIFELLKQLKKTNKALPSVKNYSFAEYYEGAHKIIKDAYISKKVVEDFSSSKDGFNCLLNVLAAEDNKKENIRYRQGYISSEDRKKILDSVKTSKESEIGALEDSIWGLTGVATNIAEAWINMSDLSKLNSTKK